MLKKVFLSCLAIWTSFNLVFTGMPSGIQIAQAAPSAECPGITNTVNQRTLNAISIDIENLKQNQESYSFWIVNTSDNTAGQSSIERADEAQTAGKANALAARKKLTDFEINLRKYAQNDCDPDQTTFNAINTTFQSVAENYNSALKGAIPRSELPTDFTPTTINYSSLASSGSEESDCTSLILPIEQKLDEAAETEDELRRKLPFDIFGVDLQSVSNEDRKILDEGYDKLKAQLNEAATLRNQAKEKGCDEGATKTRYDAANTRITNLRQKLTNAGVEISESAVSGATLAVETIKDFLGCEECKTKTNGVANILLTIFKPFCCLLWGILNTFKEYVIGISVAIAEILKDL